MATSLPVSSPTTGVWKTLSAEKISIVLKFGFHQHRLEFRVTDGPMTVIDQLYHKAETWLYKMSGNSGSDQIKGHYTIYLFRLEAAELTMVPILQSSDIEQNSLIEIVLVPSETNQHPHMLYNCQLNVPTNCSRCSRFITGVYKQGYRCRNCRMTFHKKCIKFLGDDCPVQPNNGLTNGRRSSTSSSNSLTLENPVCTDPTPSTATASMPQITCVTVYSPSGMRTNENAETIDPNKIIEKGVFPSWIRGGTGFCGRYLFRLTTNSLAITSNTSQHNQSQEYLTSSNDNETRFQLTEIDDLVLTHFAEDRDSVFEIHFRNKMILSVGKKNDPDNLQMEAAQFYAAMRDLTVTLINSTSQSSTIVTTTPINSTPPSGPVASPKSKTGNLIPLGSRPSVRRALPFEKDKEQKDLHELYAFTGEKIGEGAFGRVVGAYNKSTNEKVAVKIMEKANCSEQDLQRINGEINNLYKFNHANILKLEAYYERDDAVYLITERMETDLCQYINHKKHGRLSENLSRMIGYQIIVAIRYLHSNHCGHLDIKCENILISLLKPKTEDSSKNEYPLVKLADFGYSRIIGEHSFRKTRVGTKVYNAPEIYRGNYNRSADMWSVGIVLYAALSGTLPYDEVHSQYAEEIVRDKNRLFGNPIWGKISPDAKDLISNKLLVISQNSRVSSIDALFHDWFTDFALYVNLCEIEKRTCHLIRSKGQNLETQANWLTGERQDPVWAAYQAEHSTPKAQT